MEQERITDNSASMQTDSSSHHSSSHHSSTHHSSSHHSSTHHSSSHHSSSRRSSSHSSSKKRKRKPKKNKFKRYSKLRKFFSFLLFLSFSAVTVISAIKISVLNENRVADVFLNRDYISGVYEDVLEYSEDLCLKCSIPDEGVKAVITYQNISDIQEAYTLGSLGMDEMYSEST